MKISNVSTYISAFVLVEAEGYFVERLINLCKINNINVWNIKYVNDGKISFYTSPKDFKKMKPYIKKSKCKVKIIKKKGIYFDMFRYRKRKLAVYLLTSILLIAIVISTFIWKIDFVLDDAIDKNKVSELLNNINIKVGKNKLFISKGKISDYIRANMYEASWVGVDINGQTMKITVKAKVISNEEDKSINGNIVASKSGVITKIIAENGTALYKTGSYIEKGSVAIEGVIKSEYIDDVYVHASGILRVLNEYTFEKEYLFNEEIKESTKKTRYGFGIGINNKDFLVKYLPKENKYDITSNAKTFRVFGIDIKFIFNKYDEYIIRNVTNTKEEILKKKEEDFNLYLEEIQTENAKVMDKREYIDETEEKIVYKVVFNVEEEVGTFVKTGE